MLKILDSSTIYKKSKIALIECALDCNLEILDPRILLTKQKKDQYFLSDEDKVCVKALEEGMIDEKSGLILVKESNSNEKSKKDLEKYIQDNNIFQKVFNRNNYRYLSISSFRIHNYLSTLFSKKSFNLQTENNNTN